MKKNIPKKAGESGNNSS